MPIVHPLVLFCYNRPQHLKRTLAALKLNDLSERTDLYVFSDGPKTGEAEDGVKAVREGLRGLRGFKSVHLVERGANMGLAASVISGVTEVLQQHTACIVLEDDLETSPYFLRYMNEALHHYKDDACIFSVSGFCPPIQIPADFPFQSFLFPRVNSWGWGTWRNRWEEVDWEVKGFKGFIADKNQRSRLAQQGADLPVMLLKQQQGKITSWAVRFNQACFNRERTNVYPVHSLVRNQGADGSGTHMKASGKYAVE
ncbi:MAG: glycosyltransferase, partial [Bacteroidales bacterium]|nr:glycosyltransferase [Bacteroidales bacterium]